MYSINVYLCNTKNCYLSDKIINYYEKSEINSISHLWMVADTHMHTQTYKYTDTSTNAPIHTNI